MDKEKHDRRIARRREKEEKERLIAETSAKLLQVTEDSEKKYNMLQE